MIADRLSLDSNFDINLLTKTAGATIFRWALWVIYFTVIVWIGPTSKTPALFTNIPISKSASYSANPSTALMSVKLQGSVNISTLWCKSSYFATSNFYISLDIKIKGNPLLANEWANALPNPSLPPVITTYGLPYLLRFDLLNFLSNINVYNESLANCRAPYTAAIFFSRGYAFSQYGYKDFNFYKLYIIE